MIGKSRLNVGRQRGIKDEIGDFSRERVLDAASELFFEKGYTRTTIDDIAGRLGVTKPFIYNRFSSKAELLTEVCNRTTAFAADLAQEARDAKGAPADRLREFAYSLTIRVIESRIYLSVLFREEKHLPVAALEALRNDRKRFNSAVSALLEEGRKAGEFHFETTAIALQAITGMTTWMFSWGQAGSSIAADKLAAEMSALVLQAVGVSS